MNIHEYQAKAMFRESGVRVQPGVHCISVEQALSAYDLLESEIVAVKSQIHAGGRGKGNLYCPSSGDLIMEGGVKVASSRGEVEEYASNILGRNLVTKQTGEEGKEVGTVYFTEASDIEKEYYLAVLMDSATSKPVIIASTEGGVDIEEVAESSPEKILKVLVDPALGLRSYQARQIAFGLELSGKD